MKFFIVLTTALFYIWAQQTEAVFHDKALEEHFEKCAEEQNLTKEDTEKMKKKENLTDEKFKCFAKCLGKKDGLIKGDKFDSKGAMAVAAEIFSDKPEHKQKADEVIKACEQKLKEVTATGCDFGPAVFACLIQGAEEKKIMPDV